MGFANVVNDWAAYESLLNHIFSYELHTLPEEHPLLITEQPWSQSSQRETLAELLFERFNVIALYVARNPVLTTFAHAKSTALVIDSGYGYTSVTPVVEGYALKKSTIHIPLAGCFLAEKCSEMLTKMGVEVFPHYMVDRRSGLSGGLKTLLSDDQLPKVKHSWHDFMVKRVIHDFIASVLHVSGTPLSEQCYHQSPEFFEFPNGLYRSFADERYTIPELLFTPCDLKQMTGVSALGVHNIAVNCALSCDVDVRSQLLNNIAVVGGTTQLSGYMDRLQHSLAATVPPNMKHKVLNSAYAGDKRFCSWVGGSILGSMGTFHQLWVSKAEYLESGCRGIDIKCS